MGLNTLDRLSFCRPDKYNAEYIQNISLSNNILENENNPKISVILPVYNGALFIEEAIQSILNQTYKNFELIIINDGSTDNSKQKIEKFLKDPRVRLFEQSNRGLAATLNRGICLSRGQYIVRQDQDDISYLTRFEKQISFLETHPDYGMVGTWASIIVNNKITSRSHKHPSNSAILTFHLLFDNPFVHSSIMIRKIALDEVGVYSTDKSRQPPEDYELWSRIVRRFKVANIPEILVYYREVANSMSRTGTDPFNNNVIKISRENISWISNVSLNDIRIEAISIFSHNSNYNNQNSPNIFSSSCLFIEIIRFFFRRYPNEKIIILYQGIKILLVIWKNYFIYRYSNFLKRIFTGLHKITFFVKKRWRLPK